MAQIKCFYQHPKMEAMILLLPLPSHHRLQLASWCLWINVVQFQTKICAFLEIGVAVVDRFDHLLQKWVHYQHSKMEASVILLRNYLLICASIVILNFINKRCPILDPKLPISWNWSEPLLLIADMYIFFLQNWPNRYLWSFYMHASHWHLEVY